MKTNDIIAGLRNCSEGSHNGCRECPARKPGADCLDFLHQEAADTLEALQQRIAELEEERRWIPVTERMPEHGIPVLICVRICGDVFARVGWLHESGMWSVPTSRKWILNSVTHWMPLPESVKEWV